MRLFRYFLVGGVAAAVDLTIFVTFAKVLGWNYLMVAAVGFVVATLVNYVLSIRHVFQSGVRFTRQRELGLIYLVSAVGLLINQGVLFLGVSIIGTEMVFTKIVATGVVFIWNYAARAHFVFRHATPGTLADVPSRGPE